MPKTLKMMSRTPSPMMQQPPLAPKAGARASLPIEEDESLAGNADATQQVGDTMPTEETSPVQEIMSTLDDGEKTELLELLLAEKAAKEKEGENEVDLSNVVGEKSSDSEDEE